MPISREDGYMRARHGPAAVTAAAAEDREKSRRGEHLQPKEIHALANTSRDENIR